MKFGISISRKGFYVIIYLLIIVFLAYLTLFNKYGLLYSVLGGLVWFLGSTFHNSLRIFTNRESRLAEQEVKRMLFTSLMVIIFALISHLARNSIIPQDQNLYISLLVATFILFVEMFKLGIDVITDEPSKKKKGERR